MSIVTRIPMADSEPDNELSYDEWKFRMDRIKEMADTMSFTNSSFTSYTSVSTIRGIGSTSGKAIQLVGEAVKNSAVRLAIEFRLRRALAFQGSFSREYNKESVIVMADILEYLRLGLYPDTIRFRAWLVLLGWMVQSFFRYGGPDVLAYVLVDWAIGDLYLLINQLYTCALGNWSFHLVEPKEPGIELNLTVRQKAKMSEGVLSIITALKNEDHRAEVTELCFSLDLSPIRRQVHSYGISRLTKGSQDFLASTTFPHIQSSQYSDWGSMSKEHTLLKVVRRVPNSSVPANDQR